MENKYLVYFDARTFKFFDNMKDADIWALEIGKALNQIPIVYLRQYTIPISGVDNGY